MYVDLNSFFNNISNSCLFLVLGTKFENLKIEYRKYKYLLNISHQHWIL